MKKKTIAAIVAGALAIVAIGGVVVGLNYNTLFPEKIDADYTVDLEKFQTGVIGAHTAVHDPSVIKVDGEYYIFGTHMSAAKTQDLRSFKTIADGYSAENKVYTDLVNMDSGEFDYAGTKTSLIPTDDGAIHIWAPDVIYNEKQGLYYMYYCTTSTWNASNLCYGTSENIEGPYTWQGTLIYSGFNESQLSETNVLDVVDEEYVKKTYLNAGGKYDTDLWPNAIDPTLFYDKDGRMWMVYGSWSGGIFILEIDEETGLVIHPETDPENNADPYYGKKLLGGGHKSIEGPYIVYDEEAGYYYLFVSYGGLLADGGYQIRVFRSETPDGEYVDMNGQYPTPDKGNHSYFGLKMSGNYILPSLTKAYMAPGHNSALIDDDGKRYIFYHTRFNNNTGTHSPRVKQYFLNEEGWPCVLPHPTSGETIPENGYTKEEVVGEYYVVNLGDDISAEIKEPFKLILTERGNVFGENVSGTWSMKENTYYMHITYDGVEYSGVFCRQEDEAEVEVMTFSAVGDNTTIWGVKYE